MNDYLHDYKMNYEPKLGGVISRKLTVKVNEQALAELIPSFATIFEDEEEKKSSVVDNAKFANPQTTDIEKLM